MNPTMRQALIARYRTVNLMADAYESPRHNLQAILTRLVENVSDLQRRSA